MAWQDLYKAALLELHPEELRQRLATAGTAIHQRLYELEKAAAGPNEERHALSDALRNLRTLAKSECQHPSHNATGLPEDTDADVAS